METPTNEKEARFFGIKDSGKREDFATGAVRDTQDDKSRPDLISPFFAERLGIHLMRGAKKYTAYNWSLGIPQSRCLASLERHLMQFKQGDISEDHLSAIAFNVMAIIHNEEMFIRGLLPETLNDLHTYGKKEKDNA